MWGGFLEWIIGSVTDAFGKTVTYIKITFRNLKDVLLHVEVTLNSRPLGYLKDDVQL